VDDDDDDDGPARTHAAARPRRRASGRGGGGSSSSMRLAEFILANLEPILAEWETFARGVTAGAAMEPLALRDHAEHILRAAARDMASAQTAAEQSSKSRGRAASGDESDRLDGASDEHAVGRVESGFDLMEVVSEYRALRASVVRLWRESTPDPDRRDLDDLTRFNESIDQSLTRAVGSYTHRVNQSRELFLAILGHDLRNPLSAVSLLGKLLTNDKRLDAECCDMAARIVEGTDVIARMVTDLLEFTRTRLGSGMPISLSRVDLAELCRHVIAEFNVAYPARAVRLRCAGDVSGAWDPQRLRQVVSNLVSNALRHGSETGPVDVTVAPADARAAADAIGDAADGGARPGSAEADGAEADGDVVLTVHNEGPPIPPDAMPTLFDPLVRISSADLHKPRPQGSIGLGLYIVRQIITAHGGRIDVRSSGQAGTTFTVRLPRHGKPA
jgi:signal transduction histidine kinase